MMMVVDTQGMSKQHGDMADELDKLGEEIDHSAGIILNKKTGDSVKNGDVLATLYTNKKESLLQSSPSSISSAFR